MAVSARIQEIYLALFGRPADPVGGEYYDTLTNDGANLDPILTGPSRLSGSDEYLGRFTGMTDSQIIESIYNSLFGHNADLAGLTFYVQAMANGRAHANGQALPFPGVPAYTIEQIAVGILDGATGTDADSVANKVAAAELFTNSIDTNDELAAYQGDDAAQMARDFISGVTADPGSVPTQAQTDAELLALVTNQNVGIDVNLTANVDVVSPSAAAPLQTTADNDTIYGVITPGFGSTLNTGDNINGGDGFDTLDVLATSSSSRLVTLNSVEAVRVQSLTGGDVNLDAINWNGVQVVTLHDSQNMDLNVDNLGSNAKFQFLNNDAGGGHSTIDVNYKDGVLGTDATVNVLVVDSDGARLDVDTGGGDMITGLNIEAQGTDNAFDFTGAGADDNHLVHVTVTGAGDLEFSADQLDNLETFDASGNSGGVTADLSDSDQNITVTGGSGNDSFEVDLDQGATVHTGDGNDTVEIRDLGSNPWTDVDLDGQGGDNNALAFDSYDDAHDASNDSDFEGHIANFQTLDMTDAANIGSTSSFEIDLAGLDDINQVRLGSSSSQNPLPDETTLTESVVTQGINERPEQQTYTFQNGPIATGYFTVFSGATPDAQVHVELGDTAADVAQKAADALNAAFGGVGAVWSASGATLTVEFTEGVGDVTTYNFGGTDTPILGAGKITIVDNAVTYIAPAPEQQLLTVSDFPEPTQHDQMISVGGVDIFVPAGSDKADIAALIAFNAGAIQAANPDILNISYTSGDDHVTVNYQTNAGNVSDTFLNPDVQVNIEPSLTLDNFISGGMVDFTENWDGWLQVNLASDTSNDSINLTLENFVGNVSGGIGLQDFETLNITQLDDVMNGGNDHDFQVGGNTLKTIMISGPGGVHFHDSDFGNVTLFDASQVTGTGIDGSVYVGLGGNHNLTASGGAGDDILSAFTDSTHSATLNGNGGDDQLNGGDGADTINGGDDDDNLTGGGGADSLTGGAGNDTFFYNNSSDSTGTGVDTINDFASGSDQINLSSLIGSGNFVGNAAGLVAAHTALSGLSQDAVYDTINHQLYVDVNADGVIGAGDLVVTLTGVSSLTNDGSHTDVQM